MKITLGKHLTYLKAQQKEIKIALENQIKLHEEQESNTCGQYKS